MALFKKKDTNHRQPKTPLTNYRIFLIDDEVENLRSLSRLLSETYHVETFSCGEDALIALENRGEQIQIILTDQKMPGMNGVEILKKSLKLAPRAIRIILTAYADVNSIIQAINETRIYYYLTKPVEPDQLAIILQRAIDTYELEYQNSKLIDELQHWNNQLEEMVQQRTEELQKSLEELEKSNQELKKFANLDATTQIANRKKFDEYLQQSWQDNTTVISLIMIDVDFFKNYNDYYGHLAGDDSLYAIAQTIQRTLEKPEQIVCRYGGEEFAVILPGIASTQAKAIAEQIRINVMELKIPHAESRIYEYLTISLGVATSAPGENFRIIALIELADRCLYQSKKNGRNRTQTDVLIT